MRKRLCGRIETMSSPPCPLPERHKGKHADQVPHMMLLVGVASSRGTEGGPIRWLSADTGAPFPEPHLTDTELNTLLYETKMAFGRLMRKRARAKRGQR